MSDVKRTVSDMDVLHLAMMRKNIADFLTEMAGRFDSEKILLLDVAPQVHEGAKAYFLKAKINTLDIDPESKADIIADICQENTSMIKDAQYDFIVCT